MKQKFSPGDQVSYNPKSSPAIKMKETTVVGFDKVGQLNWKKKMCPIAKEKRNRRIENGPNENRYIIEHFFGWSPSMQTGLNPALELDRDKRYYFAYESELVLNNDGKSMG